MKKIIIAIDGFSSCGKSTMAKDLAHELGYIYVDTGAMYRCVALYALQHKLFLKDGKINIPELEAAMPNINISFKLNKETGRPDTYLNNENVENKIRTMEVSSHVSSIAAIPFVREALVAQQQKMGKDKGIVMDGRDIGTVVFPNADLKIFLVADPKERAERRFKELLSKGENISLDDIYENILKRDSLDSTRENSPLKKATDAIEVDTTGKNIEEVKNLILGLYKNKKM